MSDVLRDSVLGIYLQRLGSAWRPAATQRRVRPHVDYVMWKSAVADAAAADTTPLNRALEVAAERLLALDRLEQGLEIALAEAGRAVALDYLEEERRRSCAVFVNSCSRYPSSSRSARMPSRSRSAKSSSISPTRSGRSS